MPRRHDIDSIVEAHDARMIDEMWDTSPLDEMCEACEDDTCPFSPVFAGERGQDIPSWKREQRQKECLDYKNEPGFDEDDRPRRGNRHDYF